jgi:glycosyltransferase involved in cell wall biosynthesis
MEVQTTTPSIRSIAIKKIVFAHPSGNANVRAALSAIQGAGLLDSFYTSVACFPGSSLDRIATSIPVLSDFKKRTYARNLQSKTRTSAFWELGRIAASKAGLTGLVTHEVGYFSVDTVYHALDRKVASFISKPSLKGVGGVFAYEDGAADSFRAAKQKGLKCLYDLPIGYWRYASKLMATERETRPEWAATLTGFLNSEKKLMRKDEEIRLADHIFVASSFTARSLKEYPGNLPPVSLIPLAFPPVNREKQYDSNYNKPLKLLFVGGLSQRKGIANVFEAVKPLKKHVALTVVGQKAVKDCAALNKALSEHTWIPSLPHAEILKLMQQHDVLLFPSLFEGFGLVITEAMSQGTPVITTDRTAGPDLFNHGENGWLIEAGSTAALQERIEKILEHRNVVEAVGRAALHTAEKRPWTKYGSDLVHVLRKLLSE